ncbi:MAG: solute carrier family 23 protein [Eubacteriales bacterium]|jgi:uracil permease
MSRNKNLVYDVEETPPFSKNLVYAFQQLLAIIAATLLVPTLVNNATAGSTTVTMSQPAALFGAGVGTLVYVLCTKKRSPIFLGSSFAFISPLIGAASFGYLGIFLGAVFAGGVYVILALIIRAAGTRWVDRIMPPVIIGPTVALIGLSLCTSAVSNLQSDTTGTYNLISILVGLFSFIVTIYASVKGSRGVRMIPFIIGILAGYALGSVFTAIGWATGNDYLKIIDYSALVENFSPLTINSFFSVPDFTFIGMFEQGASELGTTGVLNVLLLFAPVALVVFAEHIADHENLGSIIGRDLIRDPGLHRTLLGDGLGSIAGSFFGGCPNTSYGEAIGCVAITGDASISTIILTSILCLLMSFFTPFVAFVNTIPTCVIGGICIALYGFIAVSGLRMIQTVDLNDNRNLFVVSAILVLGIGGLVLDFGAVQISSIATALIVGIIVNIVLRKGKSPMEERAEEERKYETGTDEKIF